MGFNKTPLIVGRLRRFSSSMGVFRRTFGSMGVVASLMSTLWVANVKAQDEVGFNAWILRAIAAPAEVPEALADGNTPGDGKESVLRRDILGALPDKSGDAPQTLDSQELENLSRLVAALDPEVDVAPSVFLEKLVGHYAWDQATRDQLSFMQMMYLPPAPVPELEGQEAESQAFARELGTYLNSLQETVVDPRTFQRDVIDSIRSIEGLAEVQRWGAVEDLCKEVVRDYPAIPAVQQREVYSLWLLSFVSRPAGEATRVGPVLVRLSGEGAFRDPGVWNLGLRALFRQVIAEQGSKERITVWQTGSRLLTPDAVGHGLGVGTLDDLDRFLAALAAARAETALPVASPVATPDDPEGRHLEPFEVLETLVSMGLDIASLRQLNQRTRLHVRDAGSAEELLDRAWRQLVLNTAPGGDPVTAFGNYSDVARSHGWSSLGAALLEPGGASQDVSEDRPDVEEVEVAEGDEPSVSPHGKMARDLVYGHPLGGLLPAQEALARSSVGDAWQALDFMGSVCVGATRDLRQAGAPLRWHLQRVTGQPLTPADGDELSGQLRATWAAATASLTGEADKDRFSVQSKYAQRLFLRSQLNRRADACATWAEQADRQGRSDLAALYWGQAMIDASLVDDLEDDAGGQLMVDRLGHVLRGQTDRDAAIEMVGRVNRELGESSAREPLLFLGATLLYESGRMADCLVALDRLQDKDPEWEDAKHLSTGLIRAVALIKLGRFEDAESVLSGLTAYRGEDEVMAQIAFLRGWIHLNRNETPLALDRFKSLVEAYPRTSYAKKTRELILRLEQTSATDL